MYIKIAYLLYTKIHKYVQAIVDFHEHNICNHEGEAASFLKFLKPPTTGWS